MTKHSTVRVYGDGVILIQTTTSKKPENNEGPWLKLGLKDGGEKSRKGEDVSLQSSMKLQTSGLDSKKRKQPNN